MVEFALIAPLFLLIVAGIIQFGLALNYWIDMQRIANQGARWAVVARYPKNDGSGAMCTSSSLCSSPYRLQDILFEQAISDGLKPLVCINYDGDPTVGSPLKVTLSTNFTLVPILEIGTLTIKADAQMRVEQPRNGVYDKANNPAGCPA
jgi:TadE-like protein